MNSMISQVQSLPELLREMFQPLDEAVRMTFNHELCLSLKRIFITGCGDSHYAALCTELAFEEIAGMPTESMNAMQFARYGSGFIPDTGPLTNLVIGVSVSGAVARVVEALEMGSQFGATTMALTATPDSRVAKAASQVLISTAPSFPEPQGVFHTPGVRSYFVNQLALLLAAIRIAEVRSKISTEEANRIRQEIKNLADPMDEMISNHLEIARSIANQTTDLSEYVFVGSGPNYATAMFSAAKVMEASGDSAVGQDTEEWNHLQYFCRQSDTPTILITAGKRDLTRTIETCVAAKTIGRRVAVIAPEDTKSVWEKADWLFLFPKVREYFSPLVTQIPGELMAACRAVVIGEPFFRAFGGGRNIASGGGVSRIQTSETWNQWQSFE